MTIKPAWDGVGGGGVAADKTGPVDTNGSRFVKALASRELEFVIAVI